MKYGRPHHLRLALCCPKDLDHLFMLNKNYIIWAEAMD